MKRCDQCRKEYSDEVDVCPVDGSTLRTIQPNAPPGSRPTFDRLAELPATERAFWSRLTLRQYAIIFVRLTAVSFIFNGVLEACALSNYIDISSSYPTLATLTANGKLSLLMLAFRILALLGVGVFMIQNTESVLHWLVKDAIAAQATDDADTSTTEPASRENRRQPP